MPPTPEIVPLAQLLRQRKLKAAEASEDAREAPSGELSLDERIAALENELGSSSGSDSSEETDEDGDEEEPPKDDDAIPALPSHLLPACAGINARKRLRKESGLAGAVRELLEGERENNKGKVSVRSLKETYVTSSHRSMYCRVCAFEAESKEALEAHWATPEHKELARVEMKASFCHLCKKQFTSPAQLKEHIGGKQHKQRVQEVKKATNTGSKEDTVVAAGMCREFKSQGRCRFGSTCKFSHDTNARSQQADGGRTAVCRNWLQNNSCHYGDQCLFSHVVAGENEAEAKTERKAEKKGAKGAKELAAPDVSSGAGGKSLEQKSLMQNSDKTKASKNIESKETDTADDEKPKNGKRAKKISAACSLEKPSKKKKRDKDEKDVQPKKKKKQRKSSESDE